MTTYIMDNAVEGERVERKTDVSLTIEQLHWAGIRHGDRVLDLGCAAGTTCRLVADLVGPSGRVVGVDASHARIADASARTVLTNVDYRLGVAEAIPLGDAEVDVAWSRFLFEYLPDPRAALQEMIRVTKPGGTVAVSDLDGNCIWHAGTTPDLRREIDAVLETFGARFNPLVGRALPALVLASELEDVRVDVRPYHMVVGAIQEPSLTHWRLKLAGVRDALVELGWDPSRAAHLADRFEAHLLDPMTFTYSILITVRGRRKP